MEPENNVGLEGCWIVECLLPYFICVVTVPHIMVRLERMLDYRGACQISEVSLYVETNYISVVTILMLL